LCNLTLRIGKNKAVLLNHRVRCFKKIFFSAIKGLRSGSTYGKEEKFGVSDFLLKKSGEKWNI